MSELQKKCLTCGKVYVIAFKYRKQKFCSRKCFHENVEVRQAMSNARLKNPMRYWLGKKRSFKDRRNISKATKIAMKDPIILQKVRKANLGRCGELANNWQGGRTKIRNLLGSLYKYKEWRKAVFERDNWTCQDCGIKSKKGLGYTVYLQAHHVKHCWRILQDNNITNSQEAINCNKLWDLDNGMTLCRDCHNKIKKETWIK